MATNTSKSTHELKGGDQPLYQPWDDFSGKPITQSQDDFRDNGPASGNLDNGAGNYTDRLNRTQSATNTLRNAENSAISPNREQSLYTGQGRHANSNTKAKGGKKKIGALVTILLMLFGGGAFLASSNSLLLDAINTLFTQDTDYQYASFSKRILKLVGYTMDSDSITTTNWKGATVYKNMSSKFKKQLADAGFTFEGTGSKKTMTWTYDTPDGTKTISGITADDFIHMYNTDTNFRDKYSLAADNRAMVFFDKSADASFNHVGNTRNEFKDYKTTGNIDTDEKIYRDTLSPKYNGDQTTLQNTGNKEEPVYDENNDPVFETDANGNKVQKTETVHETVSDSATTSSKPDADVNVKAGDMINKVSSAVGDAGGFYCAAMKFGNMISMAVAGMEIYQSIRFFMNLAEPLSKTKAGYGNESPAHSVLNWFSTKANTTVSDFSTFTINGTESGAVGSLQELKQSKSPLESSGVRNILANAAPDTNTVSSFSLERIDDSITGKISGHVNNANTIKSCARFEISNSIVSIGLTIASGGLSKIFAGLTTKLVVGTITSFAVSAFFAFLVPTIANAFFTNPFDNAAGQPGGEFFARGAGASGSQLARRNSGHSLGTKDQVLAYNKTTNSVLALDAEVDRNRRSPFDISSPNTFLGSIAYSLLPTLTSSNITSISSLLHSTMGSLASLVGVGVSADGEGSSYMTTFGDCPALESIGAAGDMYCNPITIPDNSTADLSPNDSTYQDILKKDMDCPDDNCTIKPESDLAKYITYCDGRDSPFGVVDQNILGAMQPSGANDTVSTVLGQIPIVGDIVNIIDSTSDLKNMDWATGAKCSQTGGSEVANLIANTKGDANNTSWWNSKGKYYQRYIEDSRILNIMGAYEAADTKNPVLAYQEEYEKQYLETHPEANTYVGQLSRISGLTIENTETVLAFIGYMNYIDQYDPTLRIAMDGDTTELKNGEQIAAEILQDNQNIHFETSTTEETANQPIIAHHYVIYTDTRNRSFATC